jgi:hypothetical protein
MCFEQYIFMWGGGNGHKSVCNIGKENISKFLVNRFKIQKG